MCEVLNETKNMLRINFIIKECIFVATGCLLEQLYAHSTGSSCGMTKRLLRVS